MNKKIIITLLILISLITIIGSVSAVDSDDINESINEIDNGIISDNVNDSNQPNTDTGSENCCADENESEIKNTETITNSTEDCCDEEDNITNTSEDSYDEEDNITSTDEDCCSENTTGPKTWYVSPDPENPNQVQKPTVQPVIDQASPGDIIVLEGNFVHCHFMINKTLTIIASPDTSVGVCPHHTHAMKYGTGPSTNGIFYISPEAEGTIISGFSFTNDFYYIATKLYNPFGVYVDGANVKLENLTFNWIGVKSNVSEYDPQDFLFDPIIINNTENITISNISLYNINNFIESVNSSNINVEQISIEKEKIKEALNSTIEVSNLNLKVGDSGTLKFKLTDSNGDPIANKEVNIIINGASNKISTDSTGTGSLKVKYSTAGSYYIVLSYLGDDDYKASIKNAKITVTKKASTITAPKATAKVKKTKAIKISLKSSGKAISGKKITLTVNKKTYQAKTNSKGIATIKVKINKKGTYKYTVKFAGDNSYKAISKSGKVVVKK